MKRLILSLAASAMMFSCSPLYRQIATLHSNEVDLQDDGRYVAELNDISINYDFWSENGIVAFEVFNNSTNDIFIDMSKSFFVRNGIANDYFSNSTRIISYNVSASKTNTAMKSLGALVGANVGAGISKSSTSVIPYNSKTASVSANLALAESATVAASSSLGLSVNKGESIEYREKNIICIPTKSSKVVAKFTLVDSPYRECGFIRNPKKSEKSIFVFNEDKTPLSFENRIMFIVNGEENLFANKFYVYQLQNILDKQCYEEIGRDGCNRDGAKIYTDIYSSPNKYYVNYTASYGYTDRVFSSEQSKTNNTKDNSRSDEKKDKSNKKTLRVK